MQRIEVNSEDCLPYLDGSKFDDYKRFYLKLSTSGNDRISCLRNIVEGKSVLHIGFCDHLPLFDARIAQDLWLHRHLIEVTTRCVGIDINSEAVATISSKTQIDDLYCGDVSKPGVSVIGEQDWDFAIFPDVIEHIPDPRQFLCGFVESYRNNVKRVLISVPNTQRAGALKGSLFGFETINSDHCAEYSPYTLAKLAAGAGISDFKFHYCGYSDVGLLKSALFKIFPRLSDSLILEGAIQ